MAFQTPITIKQALEAIRCQHYVLPAIQREFTWKPDQICGLFDSLMQGYPIGSFLFWGVEAEHSREYSWYGFMREYHRRKNRHCPVLDVPPKSLVAVLDGQQRLTSLNIGLRGSHAEKEPRKWWNNPHAFPTKHLYLNLLALAPENELGLKYDFRFRTPSQADADRDDDHYWFRVSDVWAFGSGKDVHKNLQVDGLGNHELAYDVLYDLYAIVHEKAVIPYFEESEQNLDKVLNIFIRVNSAGTPLSYSDLLLSIATAQWKDLDARQAIHGLVDDLNEQGHGFQISKDLVLKAGLMLSDIQSVAFRVTNFNSTNMKTLERNWTEIGVALRIAVRLLASFGFSRQTLAADSVIIPVAYYLYKRGVSDSYLDSVAFHDDRNTIRDWVSRSLVKSGIWGSGLDTTLLALRAAIQTHGDSRFPVAEVESALIKRGKGLRFTDDEVQDLLDSNYGDKRTFALLGLLYPHVDLTNVFHADHVFPRSRFTWPRMRKAGVPEEKLEEFNAKGNRLMNLQLLEGSANKSKQDKLPLAWLEEKFPDSLARENYCNLHDLGTVPGDLLGFLDFYEARRERMAVRLRAVLKAVTVKDEDGNDTGADPAGAVRRLAGEPHEC